MQRECLILLAAALAAVPLVHPRLCDSMDVRNNPANLEKLRNCTVIVGSLQILLFDKFAVEDYADFAFPELVEITHYLMFYRLTNLTTIGQLFPNLRVIRGMKLFTNYALVIYQMPELQEIGLNNLLYIARGGVKIDKCPLLCYADTIDWKKIGVTKTDFTNKNFGFCDPCMRNCNGYCWNSLHCQNLDVDKCHTECLGCTKYNSSRHCISCKNYEDNGVCVETCPKDKFKHKYVSKCVTREECGTLLNGTWWIFDNMCVSSCPHYYEQIDPGTGGCRYCGNSCFRSCPSANVDSLAALQELDACTHINGSLEIRISELHVAKELEQFVGKIVEIEGGLKIGRSKAITSLEFFRSLRVIGGEEFRVYENENLQKLWDFTDNFTLTVKSKRIIFTNNPQLCLQEIEHFAQKTGIRDRIDDQLVRESNGFKSSCNIRELNITISENHSTYVIVNWDAPSVSLEHATIVGYAIYYVESIKGNVTEEMEDICEGNGWISFFFYNNDTTYNLTNLRPFTRYGFYLETYWTTLPKEQTSIHYFTTCSDDPSEPRNFIAKTTSDTSIKLTWEAPEDTNGILSYYRLSLFLEEDYQPLIAQRDYCIHPHVAEKDEQQADESMTIGYKNGTMNCTCNQKQEVRIFQQDIGALCESAFSSNEFTSTSCNNYLYHHVSNRTENAVDFFQEINMRKRNSVKKARAGNDLDNTRMRDIRLENVNSTSYIVKKLKHFSLYIFLLSACNMNVDNKPQCSAVVMTSTRTKKRETADSVDDVSVNVKNSKVHLQWREPKDPNSIIVAYQVELNRTDLEHSKAIVECVTRSHIQKHYHQYVTFDILQLVPGKYATRVQAISLAGPGLFSDFQEFDIAAPRDKMFWVYVCFIFVFGIIIVATLSFYWWYKKKMMDNIHLIASINPDYAGVYVVDEWEVERNDIEVLKELGKGSFGMVSQGVIRSRNQPCAIKTVNDSASMLDKVEFLNEGSVMKNFNDAHHVIKLLGIVSQGQPPFVIMELMERGDLKRYLHRCREPSQNLTTNEMYRMAAEIADGMAYLAAKKYVHRDLAARNCMVHADRTVKVGDFGMARDIYETDYYRKETVGLLPVRWMAPESLADGVFTSDSDCWSYGVVLWEIATLAQQPYQGLSNEEVFRFVKSGGKLVRPDECSDKFYDIMRSCWEWRPNDRPTFRNIVDSLVGSVGEGFRLVAFCYSKKATEIALNAGPRPFNPAAMISNGEGAVFSGIDGGTTSVPYASEEDVNLFSGEQSSLNRYFSFQSPNQRYGKPSPNYPVIKPGSPDSYSLNSDSS